MEEGDDELWDVLIRLSIVDPSEYQRLIELRMYVLMYRECCDLSILCAFSCITSSLQTFMQVAGMEEPW